MVIMWTPLKFFFVVMMLENMQDDIVRKTSAHSLSRSAFFVPDTECRSVCVWSEHPVRRRSALCLLLVWERGKGDCPSSCVVSSCRGKKTLSRDLSTLWLIDETYGTKQMMDGADWMNRWVLLYDLIIRLCSTDKVIPLAKRPRRVLRVRGPFSLLKTPKLM